jgi:hypothetical protein
MEDTQDMEWGMEDILDMEWGMEDTHSIITIIMDMEDTHSTITIITDMEDTHSINSHGLDIKMNLNSFMIMEKCKA